MATENTHSQHTHTHSTLCPARMRGLYIPGYWQMVLQGRNRIWVVTLESKGARSACSQRAITVVLSFIHWEGFFLGSLHISLEFAGKIEPRSDK